MCAHTMQTNKAVKFHIVQKKSEDRDCFWDFLGFLAKSKICTKHNVKKLVKVVYGQK